MSYCDSNVVNAGETSPALRGDAARISSQMLCGCAAGIVVPAAFFRANDISDPTRAGAAING